MLFKKLYNFKLLLMHIKITIYNLKGIIMIKNILNFLSSSYNAIHDYNYGYENIDENLVRYFKTEYGDEWKVALANHLNKEEIKNVKKAA